MHILEIKKSAVPELSWRTLENRCGVSRGNLFKIAHGKRGWDVKTGAAMMEKLGVDLNDQTRVYIEKQQALAKKTKRPAPPKKRIAS